MEPVTLKLSPETSLHQVMGEIWAVGRPGSWDRGEEPERETLQQGKLPVPHHTVWLSVPPASTSSSVEGACSPRLSAPQSQGCWDIETWGEGELRKLKILDGQK